MRIIIQLLLFLLIANSFAYNFKYKSIKVFLIMILNLLFIATAINFTAFAREKDYNILSNESSHDFNIRITSSINQINTPANGVVYEIKKFSNQLFTDEIETHTFKPTITKYINIIGSDLKTEVYRKSITPDIYTAKPGYYEIREVENHGYISKSYLKFKINLDGTYMPIEGSGFEESSGTIYDPSTKIFDDSGNEINCINDSKTFYFDFTTISDYKAVIYNRASNYNMQLNPPSQFEKYISKFEIYYFNDDESNWVKIKNPSHEDGLFPVELDLYGGKNSKYDYYFSLDLSKSTKYKISEVIFPDEYKDSDDRKNHFAFEFYVNKKFEIEDSEMDSKTNSIFSIDYKNIFSSSGGKIKYNLINKNEHHSNFYKFHVMNLENKLFEKKNSSENIRYNIRVSSKFLKKNISDKEFVLKKYSDGNFQSVTEEFLFSPTKEAFVNILSDGYSAKDTWSVSPNIYSATPGFYEIRSIEPSSVSFIRFEIDSKGYFINKSSSSKNISESSGIYYDINVEGFENERVYFYDFELSENDIGLNDIFSPKNFTTESSNEEYFEGIVLESKNNLNASIHKKIISLNDGFGSFSNYEIQKNIFDYLDKGSISILCGLNIFYILVLINKKLNKDYPTSN